MAVASLGCEESAELGRVREEVRTALCALDHRAHAGAVGHGDDAASGTCRDGARAVTVTRWPASATPCGGGSDMSRMIFVNLPVADLERSKGFFEALGFAFNPDFTDENAACMVVSDDAFVMLLVEPFFATFLAEGTTTTRTGTEAITSISVGSRGEADDMLNRARGAGGMPWRPAYEIGGMYGVSFSDPDGHVWEFFHLAGE